MGEVLFVVNIVYFALSTFMILFLSFNRYLCKLTDKDLRQPDGRIMVDSMWSAVKGPVESGPICDKYVYLLLTVFTWA